MKMSEIIKSFRSQRKLEKGMNWLKKRLFAHLKNLTYDVMPDELSINGANLIYLHNYLGDEEIALITEILVADAQKELQQRMLL